MRPRAIERRPSHPTAATFALAYTALAAFVLLVIREPQPWLFIAIGIAALPFAASPRNPLAFLGPAALLLAFAVFAVGGEGALFLPALAALLYAAYRAWSAQSQPQPRKRGR